MKDLRLSGHEPGAILLESLEGETFKLAVDETLRAAVRSATSLHQTTESISPREIQDRVRAGSSVDEIIAVSGASKSYVEKFAQPVLDELAHMVDAALAIRITIAGDRFNDEVQEEFGRIIQSRLFASGAQNVVWSSRRLDVGSWNIFATFELSGEIGQAVWLFEPRKFTLSPENETAVTLSNHDSSMDGPIPKLRPVLKTAPKPVDEQHTATVTPLPLDREVENLIEVEDDEMTTSTIEFVTDEPAPIADVPAAFRKVEENPLDQLAEIQRLREEEALRAEEIAAQEATAEFPDSNPELEATSDPDAASTSDDSPAGDEINTARDPKKGRATMPTWDEIVFGTKADD